jgi:hypothetical protein
MVDNPMLGGGPIVPYPNRQQTFEPMSLSGVSTLGEPDPANITKQDLLSALAFDKHGQLLSVGDRGGRIIIFQRIEEDGEIDFDYLTEF